MHVIERFLSTLSLGYILFFYSETMFRARWRPGDTTLNLTMIWLVYSVLAFFVLLMVNHFRAGDVYSVSLVGVVFPFGIVWTPLAWHALISVLAGSIQREKPWVNGMVGGLPFFSSFLESSGGSGLPTGSLRTATQ